MKKHLTNILGISEQTIKYGLGMYEIKLYQGHPTKCFGIISVRDRMEGFVKISDRFPSFALSFSKLMRSRFTTPIIFG